MPESDLAAKCDRLKALVGELVDNLEHDPWCGLNRGLAECDCDFEELVKKVKAEIEEKDPS